MRPEVFQASITECCLQQNNIVRDVLLSCSNLSNVPFFFSEGLFHLVTDGASMLTVQSRFGWPSTSIPVSASSLVLLKIHVNIDEDPCTVLPPASVPMCFLQGSKQGLGHTRQRESSRSKSVSRAHCARRNVRQFDQLVEAPDTPAERWRHTCWEGCYRFVEENVAAV